METGMEKKKKGEWSRQTQGVGNHCVHWQSNLGRLPARLREWVSDRVLEPGQAGPFVPAAATFQSATDIYTRGLIERLACEPSARTHTPTPPPTHTHTQRHTSQCFTTTDTVGFDPQRRKARHAASVMVNIPRDQNMQRGGEGGGGLMAKPYLPKVKFRICFYFLTSTSSNDGWSLGEIDMMVKECGNCPEPLAYLETQKKTWRITHSTSKCSFKELWS